MGRECSWEISKLSLRQELLRADVGFLGLKRHQAPDGSWAESWLKNGARKERSGLKQGHSSGRNTEKSGTRRQPGSRPAG